MSGKRGRSTRAVTSAGRILKAIQHCSESWLWVAADFASIVFLASPTPFATVHLSIATGGDRRAHDSMIESPKREAQTGTEGLRHILVVDDDPMVCMAIEVYLQRNNFRVTIAEGGEAGLRALEHGQFDLMIIDIFMPHMRGFESIRIFHEWAPAVPLIAMSGYAFANLNSPAPDFLRMALELGAARCLRKPFTPHALLAAINDCLAGHRPDGDAAPAARLG